MGRRELRDIAVKCVFQYDFVCARSSVKKAECVPENFDADNPNGHPATQLPEEAKGYNYFEYGTNFKVTYPEDIKIVEMLINRKKQA